ncbi:MipA/OmpV family protein [Litorilituus lipolyticus]|uniref:MipA/OmpV family protein n=1 Tax=Litorilituus lipolyticus TaxID=2491017 RepID=A0A502KU34_9GAMM|nr:MipA/OmpV family protein [Litorilituus lipolyticus]TPH13909.1 MipA/OmpV family protein [Litorilituus lipolyticus]
MKLFFLFLIIFIPCSYTTASETQNVEVNKWDFSVYLGQGYVENPIIKLDDLKINVFPSFTYYGEKFFIDNTTIGYSLIEGDNIFFDLVGAVNEDGLFHHFQNKNYTLVNILGFKPTTGGGRKPELSGFEPIERNISYLAGLNITYMTDYFTAQLAYLTDVSGVHHGNEVRVSLSRNLVFSWFELYFEIGQVTKSKDLVSYYYKLKPEELSFLRDNYQAGEATNTFYKVQIDIPLTESFTVIGVVKETRLGDKIDESFLTDKSSYSSSFVGIKYHF